MKRIHRWVDNDRRKQYTRNPIILYSNGTSRVLIPKEPKTR